MDNEVKKENVNNEEKQEVKSPIKYLVKEKEDGSKTLTVLIENAFPLRVNYVFEQYYHNKEKNIKSHFGTFAIGLVDGLNLIKLICNTFNIKSDFLNYEYNQFVINDKDDTIELKVSQKYSPKLRKSPNEWATDEDILNGAKKNDYRNFNYNIEANIILDEKTYTPRLFIQFIQPIYNAERAKRQATQFRSEFLGDE